MATATDPNPALPTKLRHAVRQEIDRHARIETKAQYIEIQIQTILVMGDVKIHVFEEGQGRRGWSWGSWCGSRGRCWEGGGHHDH